MRLANLIFLVLMFSPLGAVAAPLLSQESRVALVMGNAEYRNGVLRNPVNDARAIAAELERFGFRVLLRENQSREGMHQSIAEFGRQLRQGGVGLFYFAGHGMQIKGRNFLIPIDADIQSEDDIEFRGMDANFVLSKMDAAKSRVNLLVLDACRNNPFIRNARGAAAGLAQMDAPKGTLIAFSTAPGALAKDGEGEHGVYTRHLIDKLSMPAAPVEQVFKEVRIAVARETQDKQIPWESSSLMGDFYFVRPSDVSSPPIPQSSPGVLPIQPAPAKPAATLPNVVIPKLVPTNANGRDYNREGYEIELRAKNLTRDELPALVAKAKQGDVIAQTTLGWAYLLGKGDIDGRGIPRNNAELLKWTRLAARKGYPVAQNNMGAIYMDGIGVSVDYEQAQKYFKLAADQGYLAARRNLLAVSAMLGKVEPGMLSDMLNGVQQQMRQSATR